jgi:hypothetical protein
MEAGLEADVSLFDDALNEIAISMGAPDDRQSSALSPRVWRLMEAARIAVIYFPDAAREMEKAAGPALDLVKEIMSALVNVPEHLSCRFYSELSSRLDTLASRRAFSDLRGDR